MNSNMKRLLTIGQLSQRFGISRSTLLYYDKLGLLQPSGRSTAGYRLYSGADVKRMEKIASLRDAGLPLAAIAEILESSSTAAIEALKARLQGIHDEMKALRNQQTLVAKLLGDKNLQLPGVMTKERWVKMLRSAGMDDQGMERWHIEFERHDAKAHEVFLQSLGLTQAEVNEIQAWSRTGSGGE